MTKNDLFLQLARSGANGASWAKKESTLAKKYIIEFDKSLTLGNGIDAIGINEINNGNFFQHIKAEIKRTISSQRCVILGTSKLEVDHKNGMKNEARVMRNEDQKLSDFQSLSKAVNDAKRQFCKEKSIYVQELGMMQNG